MSQCGPTTSRCSPNPLPHAIFPVLAATHQVNRLRIGTIEITRLGMGAAAMECIADFIARVFVERVEPEAMPGEVIAYRQTYQTLCYCFAKPGLASFHQQVYT